jgi:TonB family protein
MHSLIHNVPQYPDIPEAPVALAVLEIPCYRPPRLLVELTPWPEVFFGNLADLLSAPFHRRRPLLLTSSPAPFWTDVFVNRRLPIWPFRQSALYHLFIVAALWGLSHTLLQRPKVEAISPFTNTELTYYPVSEYLPPIDGGNLRARTARHGRPAYARQRIVSLPPHPDNVSQTIIAPSPLTIRHNVSLPNLVAWTETPVAPAPVVNGTPRLIAPANLLAVAPPPQIKREQWKLLAAQAQAVPPSPYPLQRKAPGMVPLDPVAPPPDTHASAKLPPLPVAAAVPPVPEMSARRTGAMNIAQVNSGIQPRLPVPEQQARWIRTGARASGHAKPDAEVAAPALPAGGSLTQSIKNIVVLGVNPVMPSGPIAVPQGNRRGEFMAGPEGTPGAPGTPEIRGGGTADGSEGKNSPLNGIMVAAGPVNPGPMAASGPVSAPAMSASRMGSSNALLAAMRPVRAADIARQTRPGMVSPAAGSKLEAAVFGPKKYYSMTLNMPNFTSAGGSWIIRFAELNQSHDHTDVTAPVATVKVDPAYPEGMREEGKEGVVVLYAVIHANGTVGDVRVLRSVNDRLDASARTALLKWHFQPGTKNGNAVDLEAVVQIPFKAHASF